MNITHWIPITGHRLLVTEPMSYLNGTLQNSQILITGIAGFLGRRLAQRLAEEEGAFVTGIDLNLENTAVLTHPQITLIKSDVQNQDILAQHLAGKDIVFHLAAKFGRFGGSAESAYQINVKMTEQIIRQAAAAGVKRVVFASSITAYGFPSQLIMDEQVPLDTEQREFYGRTKAIAETRAMALAKELGIEVSVIRPGMVYGPESDQWTLAMLDLIQKGIPVLFGDGSGHAYPAYVENVLDGLLLTAVHPNAANQAFNICDPAIPLHEFFGYYGKMCGRKPRRIPYWATNIIMVINKLLRLNLPITRGRLKQARLQVNYPTTKAKEMLNYQIRVPIDEGMRHTETWLREEGIL